MYRAVATKQYLSVCTSLLLALLLALPTAPASQNSKEYRLLPLATGLHYPWSLAFLPEGRILVAQLSGEFVIVEPDGSVGKPLGNVPAAIFKGQGGLSDLVLSPDFAETSKIFFSYSALVRGDKYRRFTLYVASAVLQQDSLKDVRIVFEAKAPREASVHFGAKLAFAADGTLFITSGDGFDYREQAQELDNHFGKILRISPDGSVPDDNPFVGDPDILPEIWSYGHRNQQGLVFAADGSLYSNEHGPRGGDELNLIKKGGNYGWPKTCHCLDYNFSVITPFTQAPGVEDSLKYWVPSIAPSGMTEYQGRDFPQWQGSLFVSGLASRDVRRLYRSESGKWQEEIMFGFLGKRIRNIYQTPDDKLLLVTDQTDGMLIKVYPTTPPARIPEPPPRPALTDDLSEASVTAAEQDATRPEAGTSSGPFSAPLEPAPESIESILAEIINQQELEQQKEPNSE